MLELDKNLDEVSYFYSNHNQSLMFKSPEYVKTNSDMLPKLDYWKNYKNLAGAENLKNLKSS